MYCKINHERVSNGVTLCTRRWRLPVVRLQCEQYTIYETADHCTLIPLVILSSPRVCARMFGHLCCVGNTVSPLSESSVNTPVTQGKGRQGKGSAVAAMLLTISWRRHERRPLWLISSYPSRDLPPDTDTDALCRRTPLSQSLDMTHWSYLHVLVNTICVQQIPFWVVHNIINRLINDFIEAMLKGVRKKTGLIILWQQ